MSLDKAIEHKKEKRKPYRDSRAFDYSCRNNNSCSWCRNNRLHATKKCELKHDVTEQLEDMMDNNFYYEL